MIFRTLFFLCAFALTGFAQKQPPLQPAPLDPAQAEKEGRALVKEILAQKPEQNSKMTGTLEIRSGHDRKKLQLTFEIVLLNGKWQTIYFAADSAHGVDKLTVVHFSNQPNQYVHGLTMSPEMLNLSLHEVSAAEAATNSFAGSDFSLTDLGLEFFHWPTQRLLKTEMIRSRSCRVLESIDPQPAPGAYSRVKSWIDIESNGILHAEAYDSKNKILKEFDPNVKKVNGQWQLTEMEMINRQTGSRTKIEFNLDAP